MASKKKGPSQKKTKQSKKQPKTQKTAMIGLNGTEKPKPKRKKKSKA